MITSEDQMSEKLQILYLFIFFISQPFLIILMCCVHDYMTTPSAFSKSQQLFRDGIKAVAEKHFKDEQ